MSGKEAARSPSSSSSSWPRRFHILRPPLTKPGEPVQNHNYDRRGYGSVQHAGFFRWPATDIRFRPMTQLGGVTKICGLTGVIASVISVIVAIGAVVLTIITCATGGTCWGAMLPYLVVVILALVLAVPYRWFCNWPTRSARAD